MYMYYYKTSFHKSTLHVIFSEMILLHRTVKADKRTKVRETMDVQVEVRRIRGHMPVRVTVLGQNLQRVFSLLLLLWCGTVA